MTNIKKFQDMSDDALAEWLSCWCNITLREENVDCNCFNGCKECWLDWFGKEVKE